MTKAGFSSGPAPARVFDLSETGAITITVDSKGRIRMKGFLKKNLP
jgi:hypothetical protein